MRPPVALLAVLASLPAYADDAPDVDSVGARAGGLFVCTTDCDSYYPDIPIALSL
jgi:hypothetical protein